MKMEREWREGVRRRTERSEKNIYSFSFKDVYRIFFIFYFLLKKTHVSNEVGSRE